MLAWGSRDGVCPCDWQVSAGEKSWGDGDGWHGEILSTWESGVTPGDMSPVSPAPGGPAWHTWSPPIVSRAASIITMRPRDAQERVSACLLSLSSAQSVTIIMSPLVTPPHHIMMITQIRCCLYSPHTLPLSRSVSNGNVNSSFASPTLHTWPRSRDTPRQKSKFWQHNEQFYFGMRNSPARAISSRTMHN